MEITIDFDDDEDLDGTSCGLYLVSVSHWYRRDEALLIFNRVSVDEELNELESLF